jgi:hypothetical protein
MMAVMWKSAKSELPSPSLIRHSYPAFDHLLALGLLHTFIELQFAYFHIHHNGFPSLMRLPLLLRTLFVFSSLLGIITIALAFFAKRHPLLATSTSAILYITFGVLFWFGVKNIPLTPPHQPEPAVSPLLMCAIIMFVVIFKSINATIKQHESMNGKN